jgi:hypothetical protein
VNDPDVAKGIAYIAVSLLLTAFLVWAVWSRIDEGENQENRVHPGPNLIERSERSRPSLFERSKRKVDYCIREHGDESTGAINKCLSSPLPR